MIVSLLLKQFTIHWVFLLFDFFSKMEKDEIIKLNVGGKEIIMLLSTILKFPSLPLGLMFSEEYKRPLKLENGSYFLDRDYKSFEYIVTFYRTNMIPYSILNTNELVFSEFKYWGIHTNSIDLCKPFLSEKMGNLPAIYNSKYYVHILYALENDTDESIFQLPRTYDCLVEILDIPQLIYFESMGPVTRNKIQLQQPLDKIRLYLTREAYLRTEKNIDQLCCIFSRKNAKQMNATMDVLNKNNSFIDKKYGLVYYKDGLVTKMYHY